MGKINVLSFEIANLIAAGEVVERPSSVLKELIENSIDAGAKNIVAEIKHGGVSLIRVSDDGCGIDKSDLPVALQRHATSKISGREDLNSIMTLGFRGEALAAISSVSSMTIISKTKEAASAYMLTADAGVVNDISEVYAADGTTVVVNNLFYNVPARRKFLKKDSTEAMNVAALVEKVALSRPDISIQLLIDGEERFRTAGDGELLNAIYSIFGRDFSNKLIEVAGEANGVKVSGYIGRSDNVKRNRNLMNVFINGRYVKSLTAQAAIEKAYTSYIAPECFPVCVLFMDIHPSTVDVNVHPAKLEVKFSDERAVFEAVYHTVRGAIEAHEYRPEMELKSAVRQKNYKGAYVPIGENTRGEQLSITPPPYITEKKDYSIGQGTPRNSYIGEGVSRYNIDKTMRVSSSPVGRYGEIGRGEEISPAASVKMLEKYKEAKADKDIASYIAQKNVNSDMPCENITHDAEENIPEYKLIGEAFDCYVLVEYEGELLVIDKHAAHERVIFEDLKRKREADGRIASQALMLPICINLTPDELSCAQSYSEELFGVGYAFNLSGSLCEISAIPDKMSSQDAEGLFQSMLCELKEGTGTPESTEHIMREKALYQIACKAAIKGGRKYDIQVLHWLVRKLLMIPDITVCPHGRPVAYRLTKRELDKQFERIK